MPSSLTRVISITLVFSTCPPVSVLVRARASSLGAFLGGMASGTRRLMSQLASHLGLCGSAFHWSHPYMLTAGQPSPATRSPPCPPIGQMIPTWYGNINPLSIAYACRPRLRSRLTLRRLALLRNPWAFGGGVSSPLFRYSCQHSHSWRLHGWVTPPLQSASGRSPTTPAYARIRSFGT